MKLCISILVALTATLGVSGANARIFQSHHDFSYNNPSWSEGRICVVCHTPHNAISSDNAPLWNHEETVAVFTPYKTETLNAQPGQPQGLSKLCLSCHDGMVGVDSYGGKPGGSRWINPKFKTGTDLSKHHPISFPYDETLANLDGELHSPDATSGLGGTIEEDMLFSGRLECTSCHDVHVERNEQGCDGCHQHNNGAMGTVTLSLRKSNTKSDLCLTCHDK